MSFKTVKLTVIYNELKRAILKSSARKNGFFKIKRTAEARRFTLFFFFFFFFSYYYYFIG